jgi:hypothetical protein
VDSARLVDLAGILSTMVAIAKSSKNRALIQSLTPKKPVFYNDTRWYGIFFMFKCWLELYKYVEEANWIISDCDGRRPKLIPLDRTGEFHIQIEKYTKYLGAMHRSHLAMQDQKITLGECCENMDAWIDAMCAGGAFSKPNHSLFEWNLYKKYIAPDAHIVTDAHFESGVMKIQAGEHTTLTRWEIAACARLKRIDVEANESSQSSNDTRNHTAHPNV